MIGRLVKAAIAVILFLLALDPLFGFLPLWISVPLGTIIVFIIVYKYLPVSFSPHYSEFAKLIYLRQINTLYGCVSYLLATVIDYKYSLLILSIWVLSTLVLAVIWGWKYARYSSEEQMYEVLVSLTGDEKRLKEELEHIPSSPRLFTRVITRAGNISIWKYLPGFLLASMPTLTFFFIFLLQSLSVLFALLLIAWLILGVLRLIGRGNKLNLKARESQFSLRFYQAIMGSQRLQSIKGVSGIAPILPATGIACLWIIYSALFSFSSLGPAITGIQVANPNISTFIMRITVFSPVAAYQLYYWFVILKRYPFFIQTRKHIKHIENRPNNPSCLPRGGYISFLLISFYPITLIIFKFFSNSLIEYLMISVWTVSAIFIVFLIISSTRQRAQATIKLDLSKDNLLIPLSAVTAMCGFIAFGVFWPQIIYMEEIILLATVTASLCLVFYLEDVDNFLMSKFGRSFTRIILESLWCTVMCLPFLTMIWYNFDNYELYVVRSIGYFVIGVGLAASLIVMVKGLIKYYYGRN